MKLKARTPIMVPIPVFVVAASVKTFAVTVTVPYIPASLLACACLALLSACALRIGGLSKE